MGVCGYGCGCGCGCGCVRVCVCVWECVGMGVCVGVGEYAGECVMGRGSWVMGSGEWGRRGDEEYGVGGWMGDAEIPYHMSGIYLRTEYV